MANLTFQAAKLELVADGGGDGVVLQAVTLTQD